MNAIAPTLQSARSQNDTRILQLLGSGTPANVVASVCGVSDSYVSQLLSQEDFKNEVMELKFRNVSAHNERDVKYDELEDKIAKQLESNLCLMQKPQELLRALAVVNGLKRRGSNQGIEGHNGINSTPVVSLVMPTQVVQQFTLNIDNRVIKAGEQTLETMQSHTLLQKTKKPNGVNSDGNPETGSPALLEHGSKNSDFDINEIASRLKQGKSNANIVADFKEVSPRSK